MSDQRPLVFIGSSAEGLRVAKAVQAELEHCAECVIWHQGVFGLNDGNLDSLVKAQAKYDFSILVLTPDDLVASRGDQQPAPRDNVLLELGLFIGGLGRDRTFMLVDRTAKLKLPTDLAGVTPATFQPPNNGPMRSAVGPACTEIASVIVELGRKSSTSPVFISGSIFVDHNLGKGVSIKVKNIDRKTFPPYEIAIVHPKVGVWRVFSSKKSGQLLHEQEREHRCLIHPLTGDPPIFIQALREDRELLPSGDYGDFVFRLILEDSDKILFEDDEFGTALAKLIASPDTSCKGLGYNEEAEKEFFRVLYRRWPPNMK